MNTSNYFPHNNNARSDEKLLAVRMDYGCAGYGVYFMILERLGESEDYTCPCNYKRLAFDFHCTEDEVKHIVEDYELFAFTDDGRFYSQSYIERMRIREERKEELSEKRRTAVNTRWAKEKNKKDTKPIQKNTNVEKSDTNVIQNEKSIIQTDTNKIKEKKSKEKESKDSRGTDVPLSATADDALSGGNETPENGAKGKDQDLMTQKNGGQEQIDYANLIEFWNKTTVGSFSPITSIQNQRRAMVRARIAEFGKEAFVQAIERAARSDFLKGQNNKNWQMTFDWLIKPNNFTKVLEGNYDNKDNQTTGNNEYINRQNSNGTRSDPPERKPYSRIQELGRTKFNLEGLSW